MTISAEELLRRGYRTLRGDSGALLTPDNLVLRRDQSITFMNGETATAGELVQRLRSYRPQPTIQQIIRAARRQHKARCPKCQNG